MLDSSPAAVAHCKQWSHRQNADEIDGRRVPEEFVDPRNTQFCHDRSLSVFGKVMALKTFEHKLITFLHAPVDQAEIDSLMRHRQWALRRVSRDPTLVDMDWGEVESSTATVEKSRVARIASLLDSFNRFGGINLSSAVDGKRLTIVD